MGLKSDTISVTAPTFYKKFQVPNFAHLHMPPRPRQEGMQGLPSIPLNELPEEAVHQLAEAWVAEFYEKAGQQRLAEVRCSCQA